MDMKGHILAALREEFEQWEALLSGMTEEQINTPQQPGALSVKDIVAHVMAWQQVTLTRTEAAAADKEPVLPALPPGLDLDTENNIDGINAWFYERHHNEPWPVILNSWRRGFLRLLELGAQVPERAMLDSELYAWLKGYSLALVLVATYDHHQEHLDGLRAWLQEQSTAS